MAKIRRFTALCMALTVALTAFAIPVAATDYQSKYNFWNWAYDHSWFLGKLITGAADNVCAVSEDSLHHSTNHSAGGLVDGEYTYTCVCDYCGQTFTAVATNLQETYEKETPDYTINNDGVIDGFGRLVFTKTWYPNAVSYELKHIDDRLWQVSTSSSNSYGASFGIAYEFTIAVDCEVYFNGEFSIVQTDKPDVHKNVYKGVRVLNDDETWTTITVTQPDNTKFEYHFTASAGSTYQIYTVESLNPSSSSGASNGSHDVDVYVPYVYYTTDTVSIDGAPIGGGGSIEYTDDSGNKQYIENQFFDQSTNTYHNPVTDTSSTVESWEYDYSTRTYTGHTENGDVFIQYGDENITVTEGNNIYHYYYTAPDGSGGNGGSGGSGDSSDDDGESIWDKLGELFGNLVGGLIDLISGVISGLLDSLIELVSVTLEKLGSIVDLFGDFGDALKSLWSWLPEDIVTILAAGVSVVVFASVIKLFI